MVKINSVFAVSFLLIMVPMDVSVLMSAAWQKGKFSKNHTCKGIKALVLGTHLTLACALFSGGGKPH